MEPTPKHHGEYIAKILDERRYSQKYLADKINKHRSTIHHILQREKIDLALLQDISIALGIDLVSKFYPDKKFPRIEKAEEPKAEYAQVKSSTNRTTMKLVIDIDPDDPSGISMDFISKLNDMLMEYNKGPKQ